MLIRPFNQISNIDRQPTGFVGYFESQKTRVSLAKDTVIFAGKKDLLSQPKEKIFQKICKSISLKNKLGKGAEATVYRVKGSNYCVKTPFFSKDIDSYFSLDLTIKDKINHVVAKLGNGCMLMNFIKGMPVATIDEDPEKLEYIEELIEDFPVESYSKLIKQITYAHKNEMVFDNHWANVIINPEKQTFTAIDFYSMDKYDYADIYDPTPLRSIFVSVMNMRANSDQMQICTKKLLKAGLEEMKPNYQPYIAPEEFDFTDFLQWLISYKKISLTTENLDILKQSFNKIIELKTNELAGKPVKKSLIKEIDLTNKIIDEVL